MANVATSVMKPVPACMGCAVMLIEETYINLIISLFIKNNDDANYDS